MIRGLFLFGLVFLMSLGACTANRDACGDLQKALKRCGLPSGELECGRVEQSVEESLVERLDTHGCQAIAEDDDSEAVDPRLCSLATWPCPESPIPNSPTGNAKYPLVFVSGIDGSAAFDWNPRILSAVRTSGTEVHHVQLISWATTAARAEDLWQSLSALQTRTGAKKFNLVCYAVAGLDCRYLASANGLFAGDAEASARAIDMLASITTIATPHRGTRVAEAALSALQSGASADILQTLIGTDTAVTIPDHAALTETLNGLTIEAAIAFDARIIDATEIYYQSWAGVSHVLGKSSVASESSIRAHCTGEKGEVLFMRHKDTRDTMNELLWATAPFSVTSFGVQGAVVVSPSDGMISVESAKWGTFRGCIPADHYDVIGQIGHATRDPMTGFDAPGFYRYVASDLAARGF